MDSVLDFTVRHIKLISASFVLFLLLLWAISFFSSNSIVSLTVRKEDGVAAQEAKVFINGKPLKAVTIGKGIIVTIPKDTVNITAETDREATSAPIHPPLLFGTVSLQLKQHSAISLLSTTDNDCVYRVPNATYSWDCNMPEQLSIKKITYTKTAYPAQSVIDFPEEYLKYGQRFGNGLLALNIDDGIDVSYIDLSAATPRPQRLNLDNSVYAPESVQVVVDTNNINNMVVVDQSSLAYRYYEGGNIQMPKKSGTLPSNMKQADGQTIAYTLSDGVLSRYSGISTDDIDDHSGSSRKPGGDVVRYSITGEKAISTNTLTIPCSNAAVVDTFTACLDRGMVSIYKSNNMKKPVVKLAGTTSMLTNGKQLYLLQASSIYAFSPSDATLYSIFKLDNRQISSAYFMDGKLVVTAWHTFGDGSQTRLTYLLDPDKPGKATDSVVYGYPVELPNSFAYGIDYHDGIFYVMLADNTEANQGYTKDILKKAGLLDSHQVLFF